MSLASGTISIMNINWLTFAHAGEDHINDAVEATQHILEVDPLLGSLGLVMLASIIAAATYAVTSSKTVVAYVVLLELFLIGTIGYRAFPVLSVVAITVGFILSFSNAF